MAIAAKLVVNCRESIDLVVVKEGRGWRERKRERGREREREREIENRYIIDKKKIKNISSLNSVRPYIS